VLKVQALDPMGRRWRTAFESGKPDRQLQDAVSAVWGLRPLRRRMWRGGMTILNPEANSSRALQT